MLYPKEDRLNSTLMFACRTCQFSEPAPSSCVYRNTLSNTVGETAGVTQDVASDPTVCRDSHLLSTLPLCTMCGEVMLCPRCGDGMSAVEKKNTKAVSAAEERSERPVTRFGFSDWEEDDTEDPD